MKRKNLVWKEEKNSHLIRNVFRIILRLCTEFMLRGRGIS